MNEMRNKPVFPFPQHNTNAATAAYDDDDDDD